MDFCYYLLTHGGITLFESSLESDGCEVLGFPTKETKFQGSPRNAKQRHEEAMSHLSP